MELSRLEIMIRILLNYLGFELNLPSANPHEVDHSLVDRQINPFSSIFDWSLKRILSCIMKLFFSICMPDNKGSTLFTYLFVIWVEGVVESPFVKDAALISSTTFWLFT